MADELVSKREQIMDHLVERFENMTAGTDGYTTTWNVVTRKPLGMTEVKIGSALGLFDTREDKTPDMQFMRCTLSVVCEFYHSMKIGDAPGTQLNRMLLDVQRAMRSDIYCGGLALNVVEVRSELDIDGPEDNLVAGIVEFQVLYRHYVDDPSR